MAKLIVKKNMGPRYLVTLTGHNRSLGEIECIVTLPSPARATSAIAAQRKSVFARSALLAQEFSSAIHDALIAGMKSDAA